MQQYQKNIQETVNRLSGIKIIPVLVLNSVKNGLKLCELLCRCGLKAAEITFRTREAEGIIQKASVKFPELYLGAGTILNTHDLHRAFDAGAKFAVAPGFNPNVVREAVENGFSFAPGICTPSEVEQAFDLGCTFLKFFPAEAAGGTGMLKSIIAPYKHLGIRFMPTGGVTAANVSEYLSIKEVAAVGGTWLGKSSDVEAGNWSEVEQTILSAVETAKKFH